jgi:hypothetical protein
MEGTEMTESLQTSHCDGCGQDDPDPKGHWWGNWVRNPDSREQVVIQNPSFHFDCTPEEFLEMWGNAPQHAVSLAAVEAAKSGTHGADLRAYIESLPTDNEVTPE